ncbi:MAG: peptidylprolyl isomerase [Candidatus Andersenbacteria bacterium]|nr:peptidylprolyl isomerase [Candidatus Andersenbacteria bacterium]MBI3251270.1 peptidylprolyl isomerase [Candidatus Andersenbacteria bacterium]
MNTFYAILVVVVIAIAGGYAYTQLPMKGDTSSQSPTETGTPTDNLTSNIEPMNQVVDATIKTSKGDIVVRLDGTRAPLTVGNFVKLANENFYDGTTFHRVIPDFMIQGGDPLSKDQTKRAQHGMGDPGYSFKDEINADSYGLDKQKIKDLLEPEQLSQLPPEAQEMTVKQLYEVQGYEYTTEFESLPLVRGTIAMANSGPNTNGSQFFIITAESTPHLNGRHTPFGTVVSGMDVADAITAVEADENSNPLEPITILDVVISNPTGAGE